LRDSKSWHMPLSLGSRRRRYQYHVVYIGEDYRSFMELGKKWAREIGLEMSDEPPPWRPDELYIKVPAARPHPLAAGLEVDPATFETQYERVYLIGDSSLLKLGLPPIGWDPLASRHAGQGNSQGVRERSLRGRGRDLAGGGRQREVPPLDGLPHDLWHSPGPLKGAVRPLLAWASLALSLSLVPSPLPTPPCQSLGPTPLCSRLPACGGGLP